jgi:D-alanyl-lipoteichoic acid acyltransferase DltB (MBOAT superfamily)
VADGEAEVPSLPDMMFFVLFFPQLIAGPIVLHREMGEQMRALRRGLGPGLALFGPGLVLFVFGLFKKICLADPMGFYADAAFAPDAMLHTTEAWAGAIAYALQLYFDFSGYSDMAVGLGLMFGFRLPFNFLVPFSAPSMIEYWKRWHITMTRFFTMYVYTPVALRCARLAARRRGTVRGFVLCVAVPTLLTFLLSGLWHGAGWNFVMFGAVNGVALCINHGWRAMKLPRVPFGVGWVLTAMTVLVTQVYFRSASLAQADGLLFRMFVPDHVLAAPGWLLERVPWLTLPRADFDIFGDARQTGGMILWIAVLAPLSVLLPPLSARPERLLPGWRLAAGAAAMAVLVAGLIGAPRSFLYFAF